MLLSAAMAAMIPIHLRDASGVIKGTNVWKSGMMFGKTSVGFRHGIQNTLRGQGPLLLAAAGLAAATAPRHHAMSSMGRSLGSTVGTLAGFALGGGAGGILGNVLGDKVLGKPLEKGIQFLTDIGLEYGKLHMGGDFQDSQPAWTMRQQAVQQMSSSQLNARRYLGAEAAFMHT